MKKVFLFSIKQVWELIKYIKPLYEIIAAIVKIIKNDNDNDNENAASKREKSGARSGSSEREQGRTKVNDNGNGNGNEKGGDDEK